MFCLVSELQMTAGMQHVRQRALLIGTLSAEWWLMPTFLLPWHGNLLINSPVCKHDTLLPGCF